MQDGLRDNVKLVLQRLLRVLDEQPTDLPDDARQERPPIRRRQAEQKQHDEEHGEIVALAQPLSSDRFNEVSGRKSGAERKLTIIRISRRPP